MKTIELYSHAGDLAKLAMGRDESRVGRRRGEPARWNADDDPLAWWCLTEAIANLANRHSQGRRDDPSKP